MIYECLDRILWYLPMRWSRPYRRWRLKRRIDGLTPKERQMLNDRLVMMTHMVQRSSVTVEDAARGIVMAGGEGRQ
jgi:hypothetical protein